MYWAGLTGMSQFSWFVGAEVLVVTLLLLGPSLAGADTGATCASGPDVGFIVAVKGDWQLVSADEKEHETCNNECLLKQGQLVSQGYLFKACYSNRPSDPELAPLSTFSVKIAGWDGKIDEISCQSQGSCGVPRSLPHSMVEPDSFLTRLTSAGARLFSKRPTRYAPTLARGPVLREVVLELDDNIVDFGPVFAVAPPGHYSLAARPITSGDLGDTMFEAQDVWSTGQSAVPISVNWSPGLYAISAESNAGTLESWVLLAAQPDFAELQKQFSYVEQIASDWKSSGGISESTRRALLRAILDELSKH